MECKDPKENQLNDLISLFFKVGVLISLILVVAGLIILIAISGNKSIYPYVRLEQMPAAIIISIGILFLLLTPAMPIFLAIATFLRQNNKFYLGISIIVLCLLILTLVLARI